MDDPVGVRVSDVLADLLEDHQEPRPAGVGGPPLGQELRERPALDELHGEVGAFVGQGAQLVNGHDARVLELSGDLGLLEKAVDHFGAMAEVVAEDLDGQVAAEVAVAAAEDDAHAAAADLVGELQPRGSLGQRGRPGGRSIDRGGRVVDPRVGSAGCRRGISGAVRQCALGVAVRVGLAAQGVADHAARAESPDKGRDRLAAGWAGLEVGFRHRSHSPGSVWSVRVLLPRIR